MNTYCQLVPIYIYNKVHWDRTQIKYLHMYTYIQTYIYNIFTLAEESFIPSNLNENIHIIIHTEKNVRLDSTRLVA